MVETAKVKQTAFNRKLRAAERHLASSCEWLGAWLAEAGRCELEPQWEIAPAESLIRAVAHQQLHGKAAAAILGRFMAAFPDQPFPSSTQILKIRTPKFRAMGFSLSKIEAIRGIARATEEGTVPEREEAERLTNEELIERLTTLRGIGQWSVEMFLIFTLGRMDVMPVDDFGVRAGLMHLRKLKEMPKKRDFAALTDSWAPYRSIGAWYLWRLADARKETAVAARKKAAGK
jgi:DNA-3-methyladenine glycosylase II